MSNFKTLKRRGFALFLAIVMVVALLPFSAFATLEDDFQVGYVNASSIDEFNEILKLCAGAQAGKTVSITLTGDIDGNVIIPENANIQLNLNGYSITGVAKADDASNKVNTTLTNYGTLSIIDSVTTGAITRPCDGYVIDNQGSLTVKGGHIYNKDGQSSTVRNAGEGQAATLTIEGSAVIEHDCFIAVKNDDLGILTIQGGEVVSKCPVVDGRVYPAVQNWGEATIRGGQVTGVVAVMTATWSDEFAASNTEITGNAQVCGQVKAHREATATVYPDVYVTGGRFTNYTLGEDTVAQFGYANVEGQHIFVSGGTYEQEVTREFLAEGYAYVDGTVVVKTEADENDVAEVNGKFFTSLQSAVAAADSGATVTLLQDVALDAETYGQAKMKLDPAVTIDKSLTLNLNGKTIRWTEPDPYVSLPGFPLVLSVTGKGTEVTITGNGTVDTALTDNGAYGINVINGAALTIENGTFTGNGTAVQLSEGTLNILGGTYKLAETAGAADPKYIVNVIDRFWKDGSANISITGGTFQYDPSADPEGEGTSYLPDGYGWTESTGAVGPKTVQTDSDVAEVGGVYYGVLKNAISAANPGETVRLLKDTAENITINSTVTLEISEGVTLTDNGDHTIVVLPEGNLTIRGAGTVDNVTNGKAALYNKGTITEIAGCTFTRSLENGTDFNKSVPDFNSHYTVRNAGTIRLISGGVFENRGTFSSTFINGCYNSQEVGHIGAITGAAFTGGKISLKNDPNGTIGNISNVTITGSAVDREHNASFIALLNYGTVGTVTDTVITASGQAVYTDSGYCDTAITLGKGVKATAKNNMLVLIVNQGSAGTCTANITDGEYYAVSPTGKYATLGVSGGGSLVISGGTFSAGALDMLKAHVVSGKAPIANENGSWHIDIDTTKSVRIGETYYDGLDKAAGVAADTDTIVVVKNTGIASEVTVPCALDLGSYTVNLESGASLTLGGTLTGTGKLNLTGTGNTVTANRDVSDFLTFDAAAFPVGTKIEVTEANGTFTYKLATPVARVGDEYFSTLQAAIDASNGAEVTLLVDHSENVTVAENQAVVLDLGGKTLSAKDTTHDTITSQGDLTVKNGTVRATGRNSAAVYADKGTVTVADGAVLTGGYGVYSEGADLTITAGRVEGKTALYLKEAAAAISGTAVLSSTGIGTPAMELSTNAVVTISGGTFNGAYAARGGSVTVTGGTFNSVTDKYFDCEANVTGGTFRNDMGKEIAEGCLPVRLENGWYSVVEGALAISQATATLYSDSTAGNTVTLTVTPANAAGLTWTSDNEEVATVNAQGVVTAVANGTATVTAAISNGDTVSCAVTVTNAPVYVPGGTTINDQDVPLASVLPFDDVAEEQWFYDAVKYAYENELMAGITDNLFDPQGSTTRGMIVTILYRLEGEPAVNGTSAFDDVADGQWYTDAVIWGTDNKVVAGYGDGTYRPTQSITREELAAILYRYATLKGYDVTVAEDAALNFSDADEVSAYARPAVLWCVEKGLINGMDDGTVSAGSGATRAQAAAILKSFCEQFADAE